MTAQARRIAKLVTWTESPTLEGLPEIVAGLSDADLFLAMGSDFRDTAAGRIAWAEWGRRAGYCDLKLCVSQMEGKLRVTYEGEAKPITEIPYLEIKN